MKKLMMIVDDNLSLIKNMEDYFSDTFDIVICDGPIKAVEMLAEVEPNIIITDQQMPDMTGLDFILYAIKNIPKVRNCTLMIMSAFSGKDGGESIQAAKKGGVINGFICKSTPLKNYSALIEDAFSDNERRRNEEKLTRELNDIKSKHETLIALNVRRIERDSKRDREAASIGTIIKSKSKKAA